MNTTEHVEQAKHLIDGLSIGATIATLLGWIPHIAAVLSLGWVLLRIYSAILDIKIKKKELNKP